MTTTKLMASNAYNKMMGLDVARSDSKSSLPAAYKIGKSNFLRSLEATNSAMQTGSIAAPKKSSLGVGDLIMENLSKVRNSLNASEKVSAKSLVKEASLVDVITSLNEVDVMVRTMIKMRDTVINSYNDILKMPM